MLQVTSAFKCGYHSINDLVGGFNPSEKYDSQLGL
jgi:hypothetical protein